MNYRSAKERWEMVLLIRKLLNEEKQRAGKKRQRAVCLLPGESVDEKLIYYLTNPLSWPPNVARCWMDAGVSKPMMGKHFDSCVLCLPGININKVPASVLLLMQLFLHSCGTNSVNAKEQGMKENIHLLVWVILEIWSFSFHKQDFLGCVYVFGLK